MNDALNPARARLVEQADQVRRDLSELEDQLAAREIGIDEATALEQTYRQELDDLERQLAEFDIDEHSGVRRSPTRMVIGATIVLIGLAIAIGLVGEFVQTRDDGPLQGLAGDEVDLDSVSNETMEAVIRTYADDPALADQLQLMRWRLAERYFEAGEFQPAFEHYQEILNGSPPPELASSTLTRVAWIVWVGNQEVELALQLLDRALETTPGHVEAAYVKGQVLWCGLDQPEAAIPLLESVLDEPEIDPSVRDQIEADLQAMRAGEPCS